MKCDHAHLVLVPRPEHSRGDFALVSGRVLNSGDLLHTYAGIAVYHPRMFSDCRPGRFPVVPLLQKTIDDHLVTGELHRGRWTDAGTAERLEALRDHLSGDRQA